MAICFEYPKKKEYPTQTTYFQFSTFYRAWCANEEKKLVPCWDDTYDYIQWVCTGLLQYFDLIKNGQISETFFCAIFLDEPHLVKNPICRRSPTFSSKTVVDPKLNWASSSAGRSGHLQPSKSVLSSTSMLFNVQYQYEYISHACPRYRSCTVLWSN